jgi:putative redox protein
MKDSVTLQHSENMSFAVQVNGHKMVLDASREFGGSNKGPRPKSLMLVALAGCTGNLTEEHPKHFDHMHIKYLLKGKGISEEKVKTAINLSQEKYCGVSYSLKKAMDITWELIIEE